jgi:hypothetical protein
MSAVLSMQTWAGDRLSDPRPSNEPLWIARGHVKPNATLSDVLLMQT